MFDFPPLLPHPPTVTLDLPPVVATHMNYSSIYQVHPIRISTRPPNQSSSWVSFICRDL